MAVRSYDKFEKNTPLQVRVERVGPIINDLIEKHESGSMQDGVETFQEELLNRIEAAGLLERNKFYNVEYVGTHPDNREKSMLVPIDVHDLLRLMVDDGWSWKKWNALACEVPKNEVGKKWCADNVNLANASNNLLPEYNPDLIEIVTARGSHGTCAVRCLKLGCAGVHSELCTDGNLSQSKICELQPSMEQPLNKGCPYDVVKAELVLACPRLMEVLSRTGNAGHNTFRVATMLQHCSRIHAIVKTREGSGIALDWDAIVNQSCIGMGKQFAPQAKQLVDFVRVWSGGADGHVLRELEAYERTLTVKRKLYSNDLHALSKVDLLEAPKYVPALVKASLNAPQNFVDSTGHATLFKDTDVATLQHGCKNRQFALDADKIMTEADKFIRAYGRMTDAQKTKLLSELQIRLVMHVHQKKSETRQSFDSMERIALAMYDAAKQIDDKLPKWNLIQKLEGKNEVKVSGGVGLRELRSDGLVADSTLMSQGIQAGVQMKQTGSDVVHKVIKLDKELKHVIVTIADGNGEEIKLDRFDVMRNWKVYVAPKVVLHTPISYVSPLENYDIKCSMWGGAIKTSIAEMFAKSSESNIIVQSEPKVKVFVAKAFKAGTLKLVPLTNSVSFVKVSDGATIAGSIGVVFEHDGKNVEAVLKPNLQFPKVDTVSGCARQTVEPFIVAYWACTSETMVEADANSKRSSQTVTVKAGKNQVELEIPIVTNECDLKKDDDIVLLKATAPKDDAELEAKRPKAAAKPKGGKGKSKGKGKK